MSQFLDKMGDWLTFLAETDEEYGRLSASIQAAEYLVKQAEANEYLKSTGTVDERRASARASGAYREACDRHTDAILGFRTLHSRSFESETEAANSTE